MVTSIVLIVIALIALLIYVSAVIRKRPKHPNRISAHLDKPKQGQSGLVLAPSVDESLVPKGNPRNANALDSITKEKTINQALDSSGSVANSALLSRDKQLDLTSSNAVSPEHQLRNANSQNTRVKSDTRFKSSLYHDTVANSSQEGKASTVSGKDFTRVHQPTNLSHKSAPLTVEKSQPFMDANAALNVVPPVTNPASAHTRSEPRKPFFSSPNKTPAARVASAHTSHLNVSDVGYVDMTQVNLSSNQDLLDADPNLAAQVQAQMPTWQQVRPLASFKHKVLEEEETWANRDQGADSKTDYSPISAIDASETDLDLTEDYSYNPHGSDSRKAYFSQVQTVEGTADPNNLPNFDFDHKTTYILGAQTQPEDKVDDGWLADYHFANSAASLERPPEQELSLEQERKLASEGLASSRRKPIAPEPDTSVDEEHEYEELLKQLDHELTHNFETSYDQAVANNDQQSGNYHQQSQTSKLHSTSTKAQPASHSQVQTRPTAPVLTSSHPQTLDERNFNGVNPLNASIQYQSEQGQQTYDHQLSSDRTSSSNLASNQKINSRAQASNDLNHTLADIKQELASDPQALALILSQLEQANQTTEQLAINTATSSASIEQQATRANAINSVPRSSSSQQAHTVYTRDRASTSYGHNPANSPVVTEQQATRNSNFIDDATDYKLVEAKDDLDINSSGLNHIDLVNDIPNASDLESLEDEITKSYTSFSFQHNVPSSQDEPNVVQIFNMVKPGKDITNFMAFVLYPMRSKVFSHDSITNFIRRHSSEFTTNQHNKSFCSFYDYTDENQVNKKLVLYETFTDKGPFNTDYSEYSYLVIFIDKRIFAPANENFLSILLSRLHVMTVDLKGDLYWRGVSVKKDSVSYPPSRFRRYLYSLTHDDMLNEHDHV